MYVQEAMGQALLAARSVEGRTAPRPPVGAVIVRDGEIIARGATAPPYGPHAEMMALSAAGPAAQGTDLYVTLEPCCVTIHTPPCTTAIIDAGIRRVFVGALDPNPAICSRGMQLLRDAGIEVTLLENEHDAQALLRPFATFITSRRSYVTAKWAMTLDGKMATRTGASSWISGGESRLWVHDLRDRVDAILIGANTARIDNPQLTVRLAPEQRRYERTTRGEAPRRVVLSTHGKLPGHLHLLQSSQQGETWVIVGESCPSERRRSLESSGVTVVSVAEHDGRVSVLAALQVLAQRGIMHVLLEGGADLLGSAYDSGCIDHVAAFIAPVLIGGAAAPSPVAGQGKAEIMHGCVLCDRQVHYFGEDILVEGDVVYEQPSFLQTGEEQKRDVQ